MRTRGTISSDREKPRTLSVIVPVLNEAETLPETVRRLQAVPEVQEILVVDGGSTDGTPTLARQLGCRVLESPPGRGRQMRVGAAAAQADAVLLLHADTWVAPDAGRAALECLSDPRVAGGGFWKEFRDTPFLLLGSKWKCAVRLIVGRRIAGDQGLFVRRELLERIGGVPDMELMEEFELCRRLRRHGRLVLANSIVQTSPRRFVRQGILRTYWRMWLVSMCYRFGMPTSQLRRLYERQ